MRGIASNGLGSVFLKFVSDWRSGCSIFGVRPMDAFLAALSFFSASEAASETDASFSLASDRALVARASRSCAFNTCSESAPYLRVASATSRVAMVALRCAASVASPARWDALDALSNADWAAFRLAFTSEAPDLEPADRCLPIVRPVRSEARCVEAIADSSCLNAPDWKRTDNDRYPCASSVAMNHPPVRRASIASAAAAVIGVP